MEDGKVSRFPVSCKRNLLLGFIVLHIYCRTGILPRVVHPLLSNPTQGVNRYGELTQIHDKQSPSFIEKRNSLKVVLNAEKKA